MALEKVLTFKDFLLECECGGGGGAYTAGTHGSGVSGGGNGGSGSNNGSNGTVNRGGGGGGAGQDMPNSGSGGSGILILKIPNANSAAFSGTSWTVNGTSNPSQPTPDTSVSGYKIYFVTAAASAYVTFS